MVVLLGAALGGSAPLAVEGKKGRCYKKWCDYKYPCCKKKHRCIKPSPLMPGPHCLKP